MRDGQPVPGLGDGAAAIHPWLRPRLRRVRAQGDGDGAGRSLAARRRARRGAHGAGPGRGVRALSFRQRRGLRLRAALEAAALRRFPVRAQPHPPFAPGRGIGRRDIVRGGGMSGEKKQAASAQGYKFSYLDEQTEPMIRRGNLHALAEYGAMYVRLYEDIARYGRVITAYDYPVMVNHRYLMRPSPIPKFDNPKMNMNPALQLFGAGREKRIYAVPPHTAVKSLDFIDHPFAVEGWEQCCATCGATDSFLDEVVTDDCGGRIFVCSDTDYCNGRRADQAAE